MTKEEVIKLNDTIREKFPDVNCYMHCLILKGCLDSEGVFGRIMYNGDHCAFWVMYSKGFFLDNNCFPLDETSNYKDINQYGSDIVLSLLEPNTIKWTQTIS